MLPLFAAVVGYVDEMSTPEIAYALGETNENVKASAVIARDSLLDRAFISDPFARKTIISIQGYRQMLDVFSLLAGQRWEFYLTEQEAVELIELKAYYRAMRNYVNFSRLAKEHQHVIQTHHHAGRRRTA